MVVSHHSSTNSLQAYRAHLCIRQPYLLLLHWIKVCICSVLIKDLVAVHDGYEVLGVGEVDDVVGVAGEHDDGLDFVTTYLIVQNFGIRIGFVS